MRYAIVTQEITPRVGNQLGSGQAVLNLVAVGPDQVARLVDQGEVVDAHSSDLEHAIPVGTLIVVGQVDGLWIVFVAHD